MKNNGSKSVVETAPKQKSVCVAHARGCLRAEVDMVRVCKYFQANGWNVEAGLEQADMVVVFGCGVDEKAEQASTRLLSIADRKRRSGSRLVVLGCLAGINQPRLLEQFDAIVVRPSQIHTLDQITGATVKLKETADAHCLQPQLDRAKRHFGPVDRFRASFEFSREFGGKVLDYSRRKIGSLLSRKPPDKCADNIFKIEVARGCLGRCSYCAIRFADGRLRSKPLDEVLAEFDAGLKEGHKEFELVAGDLGAYGQDIRTNFVELVRALFQRKGAFRLRLVEVGPGWMVRYRTQLTELLAANRERVGCLRVPLQSGSEKILKLMHRPYTAADVRECLCRLQQEAPHIRMETHVIIGFPGEEEDDFAQTVQFLRSVHFDEILVFKYSDRPGAEAGQLRNKVPQSVKTARVGQLRHEFGRACKLAF